MSRIAPAPADDDAAASAGDIVSLYPWLVVPFAVFNIISWVLAVLEVSGVVGLAGYAAMDLLYPVDISFCQMMFWGTLHYGPISDGRLANVCRIAFLIEAGCYLMRNVVVYQPFTVEDAMQYDLTGEIGFLSQAFMILRAGFFFFVFAPFAAYLGTIVLQVARRRLIAAIPRDKLPPFSTSFLQGYVLVLSVQVALMVWRTFATGAAATPEEIVFATKLNYSVRAVSGIIAQVKGWKSIIFDASGVSPSEWLSGKGTKLQTAAVGCGVTFVVVVVVDLILLACASSSADPLLVFHNWLEVGFENLPMMGLWVCALFNLRIDLQYLHPLRSVDKTTEFLEKRKQAKLAGGTTKTELHHSSVEA